MTRHGSSSLIQKSPKIPADVIDRRPEAQLAPLPHTAPEITRLVDMLDARGASAIVIGHGRHDSSTSAASWSRQAHRLGAGKPDAWVVADNPVGWAQMARRLATSTTWHPSRTLGFASLGVSELITLAGADIVDGMAGATASGHM